MMATRKKKPSPSGSGASSRDDTPGAPAAAPAGRRAGFKGLEKVMVRLRPEQAEALRAEAVRRAAGSFVRPDASEVLREILDGELDPKVLFGRR